ncbi:YqhR family membrane protein [Metabacillus sp. SLBN-84]
MTDDFQSNSAGMKDEQDEKQGEGLPFIARAMITGFAGGIFWSLIGYLAYVLNMTEISPNMLLQPFLLGDWKNGTIGNFAGVLVIGFLSVGTALVYYLVLKRFSSIFVGMIYGAALWALVFFLLNPIFPNVKTVFELERLTTVTMICLYILYGVFIGYSISFEQNELQSKKKGSAST